TLEGKILEDLFIRPITKEEVSAALKDMKERAEADIIANEKMIAEIAAAEKKEDTNVYVSPKKERKFPPKASLEIANEEAKRAEQQNKQD
ncbi:MAG: hypothetical protein FWF37_00285, partial [Chloroflexi bacterium]|nr:hypothetical protein [Chloroflexota bacterium]